MPPTRRVLVIDDDDLIREVTQASLQLVGGWQVSCAGGAIEGIATARREQPDAILMDVMMPGLDGPSAAAQLRADPLTWEIPVILLTARARAEDRRRWTESGVRGVINKPFDPMRLVDTVSRLLDWTGPD